MQPFYTAYYDRLKSIYTDIERTIDGLPQAALDWVPRPDMNTFAVLITHTAGATRYWIGDVAGQDPSVRVREEEFRTHGVDAAILSRRLAAVLEHTRGVLEALSTDDLGAQRMSPRHQEIFSVSDALLHALDHAALHLGHMQIARQLWDQNHVAEGKV